MRLISKISREKEIFLRLFRNIVLSLVPPRNVLLFVPFRPPDRSAIFKIAFDRPLHFRLDAARNRSDNNIDAQIAPLKY